MIGFSTHVVLFLVLSVPIVVMGSFYAEPRDAPALRGLPRRYLRFVVACAVVAGIMLLLESWFTAVD